MAALEKAKHYLQYLLNVMDMLDRNKMKSYYIVMDNAPIHTLRPFET